ncbi:hypothetical protein [Ferrimonas sediminum]|uniref:hypothetical protein n=1 Tax=Ferrimonas sediminum TaxID=718193 RepID=UPI00115F795F|nr:hypothetical protein [Ferrimonas sediminum]
MRWFMVALHRNPCPGMMATRARQGKSIRRRQHRQGSMGWPIHRPTTQPLTFFSDESPEDYP